MRIKKVKVKDGKMYIEYQMKVKKQWDDFTLHCMDKARPEYDKALDGLKKHVVEMCELPKDYINRITVKGVSFSYGGDKEVMGAVITATMVLKNTNCPLNINTPHKASDLYGDEGDESQLLTGFCVRALEAVQAEAVAYIKGDRAQLELPLAGAGKPA
jgi:hypothetical protein